MGEEFDLEMLLSYLTIAIAKRDEIIDRMETRIVNLTGERDSLKKCMKYMKYDEDGYYQDSLRIRCKNCPFMIDGECRVRE